MEHAEGLERLRGDLDLIDELLLDALRARIECCVRIAEFKREHDIPMMQPHRINFVQERAAQYATEHNIAPAFLRNLYELVIAETCRVEDLVMSGSGQ
ncbi:chorismate mutase family protein [Alicyclobacillus sp. ALC3]|uniref:chorismate mutase family protein n=1 Tax=Alicyclobacillus sp. ALC3 TaxID=2796143 RepID=UPI0023794D12|nr:chorismate mutase family protein [Alicyclobacillus sp. ALC3]WDL95268.1 chorismate mutase family protein [Alicyclobacillus sp. ALC3]